MRCVLVGNYGAGNIGDEALREYFLTAFPGVTWTVVSARPRQGEVPRLPLGPFSFFSPWWKTLSAIKNADALVFGGGSLFTDLESVKACVLWWMYAGAARFFGTPYMLAFQGVGPFRTAFGRMLAASAVRHAAFLSVRDEESLERVRDLGAGAEPILTFDPAFALFAAHRKSAPAGQSLVIIPRANSNGRFFAAVSEKLRGQWDGISILLLEPEREGGVARRLQAIAPGARVAPVRSVGQLLTEMAPASSAIVQRYHGALAALAMNIPVEIVPQGAGDKMEALNTKITEQGSQSQRWLSAIDSGKKALEDILKTLARS